MTDHVKIVEDPFIRALVAEVKAARETIATLTRERDEARRERDEIRREQEFVAARATNKPLGGDELTDEQMDAIWVAASQL